MYDIKPVAQSKPSNTMEDLYEIRSEANNVENEKSKRSHSMVDHEQHKRNQKDGQGIQRKKTKMKVS